ncbi:hypothetical protein BLNAU_25088 [Blattamonas nauphoetae]|uniref:Uncharacterized protein n=1 Tax=Blattamonas nauphoetae TaxID=2049346 RepID=A0ABQ9WKK2_9EUKA|nr:hypothetical protein BLNAU_25088 [Blattamonas nauphoetae]
MVTADGIIVTFEHGDEETEGMQGELFGYWMERAPTPFGTVNRDLNFGGSIISLNNSFLYYHTRGPQTPLSNANIIKENINPGQSDHVRVEYTTSNATNSDTVILTYCNFLDISTTVKGGAIFFDRILSKIHLKHCNFVRDSRSDRLSWCCPERTRCTSERVRSSPQVQAEQNHPNLTKLCTFSSDNVFNKIEQLRMIFPPNSSHHRPRRPHLPFAPASSSSRASSSSSSLRSYIRSGRRWVTSRTMGPVHTQSDRLLCTIQFGDALAEALSFSFRSSEGDRAGRREASPNTSHFLVAQDSLNITILNKLPILPNFIPDTTSKEYAMKVTGLEGGTGRCEYNIHLRASSPFLLLHVYHSLCFFVCLGGVAVRTLIRQYHPAVLLFLADHSAAVGAEVQSNLIMWLVNSLFSDVHAIDQGRMDLLRSPVWIVSLVQAAEGMCARRNLLVLLVDYSFMQLQEGTRRRSSRAPAHRLHAAPVCGRGGAGVGAIPMGQGGGCGAVHVCVGAVGECPVTLHQLYLRQIRLDEPVSPLPIKSQAINKTRVVGVYSRLSSLTDTFRLFSHSNAVLHQHPLVLTALAAFSQSPNFWEMNQARLMLLNLYSSLRSSSASTGHSSSRRASGVRSQAQSDLPRRGDQLARDDRDEHPCSAHVRVPALKMRAAARSAFLRCCCSTSRSDSVHIRTAEEMLLFDVELRFRPHPYSRRDASVRRRARRFHLTTTSRSAVEDSDAALRIIYSLALPTPHPHHRSTSSREEHASPDNHPRPHNHQSVREVAALVEKALDKRALNLSRDNRNEMQMAARQNTSPSRSILTCSHHPLDSSSAQSRILPSTPHAPAARREGHGADRPPPPHPHRHSPPLHLRLPPLLNEFKQAGIHQQSNVEFFQMRMGQKDPAIALVAAQFLKGHSFLRKD